MVNLRLLSAPFLSLALCLARPGAAKELSDYRLGDRVEADIKTPFALKVLLGVSDVLQVFHRIVHGRIF